MKKLILVALLSSALIAHAQTKKELVQKLLTLQQPGIENLAKNMVEQPAGQMMQQAGMVLQQQVPADQREAVGKNIQTEIKKYVDESVPPMRERAVKLAPSTIGATLEEKFSEDELKQLIAWFDSPVNKKYLQLGPEMQTAFMQKLVAEARPILDPKLQALEQKVRTALGGPAGAASSSSAAPSPAPKPAKATAPAKAASK